MAFNPWFVASGGQVGPNLQVKVTGVQAAANTVRALGKRAQDNDELFKRASKKYGSAVLEVFKSEGGKYNVPKWKALSPMRQRQRGALRPGKEKHPILRWDDSLKNVVSGKAMSGDGISAAQTFGKTAFDWTIAGAKVGHESGYQGPRGYVPARDFWPWDASIEDKLFKVWEDEYDKFLGP